MFAHLKGTIDSLGTDHLIIDVHGVGYHVFASRITLAALHLNDAAKLSIETLMRQESLQLFGFLTAHEHTWFRLLLTVQGVGPKVALGILGSLGLNDLAHALSTQDKTMLSRADGVGPKLAGRILLELKDKSPTLDAASMQEAQTLLGHAAFMPTGPLDDALQALIQLGYARNEARSALLHIPEDIRLQGDAAMLIRTALQAMPLRRSG